MIEFPSAVSIPMRLTLVLEEGVKNGRSRGTTALFGLTESNIPGGAGRKSGHERRTLRWPFILSSTDVHGPAAILADVFAGVDDPVTDRQGVASSRSYHRDCGPAQGAGDLSFQQCEVAATAASHPHRRNWLLSSRSRPTTSGRTSMQ